MGVYTINTSNEYKINEYKKYLSDTIRILNHDLPEPKSDSLTIIRYKASQFNEVLVDDCSLEIEGTAIGPMIKWYLDVLDQYSGKQALFTCLMALRKDNKIYVYRGQVLGTIVESRGKKYGFVSYFQPDGTDKTLAQERLEDHNPRYHAIQHFLNNQPYTIEEPLYEWHGLFQE